MATFIISEKSFNTNNTHENIYLRKESERKDFRYSKLAKSPSNGLLDPTEGLQVDVVPKDQSFVKANRFEECFQSSCASRHSMGSKGNLEFNWIDSTHCLELETRA
jgi:hypothetical protein